MIPYDVLINERVEKDLRKVPNHIVEKFLNLLDEFENDPIRARSGFDAKQLKGFSGCLHRLRIGDYRVLYSIDNDTELYELLQSCTEAVCTSKVIRKC
ncbi:MAG TPA: type II toxin-antitoxin system RelE/ParE family toxin [Methanosarcinaceae archaeon]|nr:type II toxin-antitoxin system RelE/ParE family toxin [Methanosarcinaceae archaeon]